MFIFYTVEVEGVVLTFFPLAPDDCAVEHGCSAPARYYCEEDKDGVDAAEGLEDASDYEADGEKEGGAEDVQVAHLGGARRGESASKRVKRRGEHAMLCASTRRLAAVRTGLRAGSWWRIEDVEDRLDAEMVRIRAL